MYGLTPISQSSTAIARALPVVQHSWEPHLLVCLPDAQQGVFLDIVAKHAGWTTTTISCFDWLCYGDGTDLRPQAVLLDAWSLREPGARTAAQARLHQTGGKLMLLVDGFTPPAEEQIIVAQFQPAVLLPLFFSLDCFEEALAKILSPTN